MRSVKLLMAAAILSTLIAGPVLAQDAMMGDTMTETTMAPASDTAKVVSKSTHHAKKHAAKTHKKAAAHKKHAKKAMNNGVTVK